MKNSQQPAQDIPQNLQNLNVPSDAKRGEIIEDQPVVIAETVTVPAKVMRIGSMIKQLLDEVHSMTLDNPSRERLAEIYERSIVELTTALSPDLQDRKSVV